MTKLDIYQIEENWDTGYALLDEVAREINLLIDRGTLTENNLELLNKKIDNLRETWLKVDNIDEQIRDLRFYLLKSAINNKIEELNNNWSNYALDISKIKKIYGQLIREKWIDIEQIDELMDRLSIEVTRAKIRHMINDIQESQWTSIHSLDSVVEEIQKAKKNWIDVEDLEEIVFEA